MEKIDKKIKLIIYAISGLVILTAAYFVLSNFVLTADIETGDLTLSPKTASAPIKINVNLEKLDASILQDERFKNLKSIEVKKPDISELKIGKENPFSAL